MKFDKLAVLAALAFAAVTASATSASAVVAQLPEVVYTFTGQCTDCVGVGTGVLTFRGTPTDGYYTLDSSTFESFTYNSSILTDYTISSPTTIFSGELSTTAGTADATISDGVHAITTNYAGSWCVGQSCLQRADYGSSHTWTPGLISGAPEPATWALMIVGIGLAGAALRRKPTGASATAAA